MTNTLKIVQTDEGLKAWRNNELVAYVDENDLAFAIVDGSAMRLDYADNEREFRQLIDMFEKGKK